ncbi:MAG: hypothetical protein HKN20_11800 [Gemmatimonadetes bacterium]|nr:hypothetical protein [Gemmatimonadota bacterium]
MRCLLTVLLAVFLNSSTSHAASWLIKADGTGDAPTIQDGIAAAGVSGDTVFVDDGTFTGVGNRGIDFSGKDVVVRSVNSAALSILDANCSDRLFILQSGETSGARIERLTLRNGFSGPYGGGIYCLNASNPTISECVIEECEATERGGGIALRSNSNPTIVDCTIRNNTSGLDGGGVCAFESSPDITNTVFDGNTTGEYGGGLLCHASTGTIDNCEFRNNVAGWGGGGISMWVNTTATFANCTVENDSCGAAVGGGGLHVRNSSPTMSGMTIRSNKSEGRGGGIHYTNGSAGSITDSEIALNQASLSGGGIDAFKSSPYIARNLVHGNEAGEYGGGILCDEFTNTIEECLIYGNTGTLNGGGLSIWSNSSATLQSLTIARNSSGGAGGGIHSRNSTVTLDRSILAFATSGQAGFCEVGGTITATCSDIHGNFGGDYVDCLAGQNGVNGNIDEDPLFCDKAGDDYTIANSSPAALAACGHMGSEPTGCGGPTATEETSWGEVKQMFR